MAHKIGKSKICSGRKSQNSQKKIPLLLRRNTVKFHFRCTWVCSRIARSHFTLVLQELLHIDTTNIFQNVNTVESLKSTYVVYYLKSVLC